MLLLKYYQQNKWKNNWKLVGAFKINGDVKRLCNSPNYIIVLQEIQALSANVTYLHSWTLVVKHCNELGGAGAVVVEHCLSRDDAAIVGSPQSQAGCRQQTLGVQQLELSGDDVGNNLHIMGRAIGLDHNTAEKSTGS